MSRIKVDKNPDPQHLQQLQIKNWPVWTKEVSEFPWFYDEAETCYFLEGDVVVTTEDGQTVAVGKGDLVTFPAGMACRWQIRQSVKKHYRLG